MHSFDRTIGNDKVGIAAGFAMHESGIHNTNWSVHRYDDDIYEKQAKGLFVRASELLILANYEKMRGNIKEFLRRITHVQELMREGEAWAYNISAIPGNILLNEGIDEMWDIVTGTGAPTVFNSTNSHLGVGDSSAAESAAQTALQATTNKLYKIVDGGYPTATTQKATWKTTFGGTEANFSWQEFTVANGNNDTAKNINRKISNQGTKTSGQTWALTIDITLS